MPETPMEERWGRCGILDAALTAVEENDTLLPEDRRRLMERLQTLQAGFCAGRRNCRLCDRATACQQVVRMLFCANGIPSDTVVHGGDALPD